MSGQSTSRTPSAQFAKLSVFLEKLCLVVRRRGSRVRGLKPLPHCDSRIVSDLHLPDGRATPELAHGRHFRVTYSAGPVRGRARRDILAVDNGASDCYAGHTEMRETRVAREFAPRRSCRNPSSRPAVGHDGVEQRQPSMSTCSLVSRHPNGITGLCGARIEMGLFGQRTRTGGTEACGTGGTQRDGGLRGTKA